MVLYLLRDRYRRRENRFRNEHSLNKGHSQFTFRDGEFRSCTEDRIYKIIISILS